MADLEMTGVDGGDDVGYREVGVDVEGLVDTKLQNPETASQQSTEETDGGKHKKKKKGPQRIQDGKFFECVSCDR